MSLNQIVQNNYKEWLDPYVNSIKIDNNWQYKQSTKANGDNLVLDTDLVAQWVPINATTTPYGNGISTRINNTNLASFDVRLPLSYTVPFSPIFNFNDGDNFITIAQTGVYIAYVNLATSTNLNYSVKMKLQLAAASTYSDIIGSEVKSFPGSVVFSGIAPYLQESCVNSVCLLNITSANTKVSIAASTSTATTIDKQYSSFTIIKL